MLQHEPLILASASTIRKELLARAGLQFQVFPADIDETAIKNAILHEQEDLAPADVALLLAQTKASVISQQHPGALVIGSDQILVHEQKIFSKPATIEEARQQLMDLRGKTHELISAVCVAAAGETIWSHDEAARLTMRSVSNSFIGTYIGTVGEEVTQSVGAYKLEGLGIHLFEKVEGDYFTILGLPMLAVLEFLRSRSSELV